MEKIHETIDSNAEIIFGTTSDKSLEKDEVKITIVATGFESSNNDSSPIDSEEETIPTQKISIDEENHLDTPPLMRNYQIQYSL